MVKNAGLIGAAALLAVGAYVLYQRQQESGTQAEEQGTGDWLDGQSSDNALSAFSDWLNGTGSSESGYINTSDEEQTSVFGDTMNTIKNWLGSNEIAAVVEAGPGYLVVRRPDGTVQKLQGSRNWRNNNPGNINYGDYAVSMGAIGTDGRFAVFPTYAIGKAAKEKLIFEGSGYRGLTLTQMINRYAPPSENNTTWYQNIVLAAVGGINKLMNQYTTAERTKILAAMEKVEGFKPGTVTNFETT